MLHIEIQLVAEASIVEKRVAAECTAVGTHLDLDAEFDTVDFADTVDTVDIGNTVLVAGIAHAGYAVLAAETAHDVQFAQ